MMACPCGGRADTADNSYQNCCQPLHDGRAFADTAEQLMRSRYSAFYLKNIDYIIATTAPAQQSQLDKPAIRAWADEMTWTRLHIVSHTPKIGKRHAQVHFRAYFDNTKNNSDESGEGCHDERSAFVKIDGRWYFLDPTVPILLTNKQPCLCGSGEKFKACCGKFLG